jgi:hypothetical protein
VLPPTTDLQKFYGELCAQNDWTRYEWTGVARDLAKITSKRRSNGAHPRRGPVTGFRFLNANSELPIPCDSTLTESRKSGENNDTAPQLERFTISLPQEHWHKHRLASRSEAEKSQHRR